MEEIGVSVQDAVLIYHLAPTQIRREISIQGLLWKIVNGQSFYPLNELVTLEDQHTIRSSVRLNNDRHQQRLKLVSKNTDLEIYRRSIAFNGVKIWNELPARITSQRSIKHFQQKLQFLLVECICK